jgi:hypothetical protein
MRGVTRNGKINDFAKTTDNETEFAGGTFDPNGQILFVSQQGDRGKLPDGPPNSGAVMYAIWGPWSIEVSTGRSDRARARTRREATRRGYSDCGVPSPQEVAW